MRIVFDNIAFSLQKAGGISVVWYELISRFIGYNQDDLVFLQYKGCTDNIFMRCLDFGRLNMVYINTLSVKLSRYIDPYINGSEPFIFQSTYYRLCRNKKAINVTTVHDFTYDYFYKKNHRGAFIHLWQRNKAIRHSDAVVCISENTKKDLFKFVPDIDPKKVFVIYNGVADDYKVVPNVINEYKNYLLFVGGRNAFKNGKFFVESIKDTKYKVLFCGKPLSEEERKLYNSLIGEERYKVLCGLSNEELNRIYNSVKCLVYPSSYEGFGIPIIEAQKSGCPVIAYNSSSIPEVLGDSPLMMKELSKEELLLKLNMLEDESLRKEVISKGLENVKRFSWDHAFVEYRKLYETLLNSKLNKE